MTVTRLLLIVAIIIFVDILAVFGDEWVSPDGVLTVVPPDRDNFQRLDDPPAPFMVAWISNDQRLTLGVMEMTIPRIVKLIRSSAEEGMAEEIGGTVTDSSVAVKNGREIWFMTAKGSALGVDVQVTQAMARHDDKL